MNLADYLLIGVIAVWFAASLFLLIRAKKRGKCCSCSSCNGNCSLCSAKCAKQKKKEKK